MRVLSGFTQKAGGRTYTLLYDLHTADARATGKMAAHVAKAGAGLAKKKPDIAAKLLLEQFPAVACVEVRAGSMTTKVLR
jgi:hypothetical protein